MDKKFDDLRDPIVTKEQARAVIRMLEATDDRGDAALWPDNYGVATARIARWQEAKKVLLAHE